MMKETKETADVLAAREQFGRAREHASRCERSLEAANAALGDADATAARELAEGGTPTIDFAALRQAVEMAEDNFRVACQALPILEAKLTEAIANAAALRAEDGRLAYLATLKKLPEALLALASALDACEAAHSGNGYAGAPHRLIFPRIGVSEIRWPAAESMRRAAKTISENASFGIVAFEVYPSSVVPLPTPARRNPGAAPHRDIGGSIAVSLSPTHLASEILAPAVDGIRQWLVREPLPSARTLKASCGPFFGEATFVLTALKGAAAPHDLGNRIERSWRQLGKAIGEDIVRLLGTGPFTAGAELTPPRSDAAATRVMALLSHCRPALEFSIVHAPAAATLRSQISVGLDELAEIGGAARTGIGLEGLQDRLANIFSAFGTALAQQMESLLTPGAGARSNVGAR